MQKDLDIIILAGGKGKRMHQAFPGVPKVLVPLHGRPMLLRLCDAVSALRNTHLTVVVGPLVADAVKVALHDVPATYAVQEDPKGTGHAVLTAKDAVSGAPATLVLMGDHPLVQQKTIQQLVDTHTAHHAAITLLTVPLNNFSDWHAGFADWGRIVRDANGKFVRIVEAKDASRDELALAEVNPGMYIFDSAWLWAHLPKLSTKNKQGEYYLTDLLEMAVAEDAKVETVPVADPRETMGANTPEQLATLEHIFSDLGRA